jgi:hypothetical protein
MPPQSSLAATSLSEAFVHVQSTSRTAQAEGPYSFTHRCRDRWQCVSQTRKTKAILELTEIGTVKLSISRLPQCMSQVRRGGSANTITKVGREALGVCLIVPRAANVDPFQAYRVQITQACVAPPAAMYRAAVLEIKS